MARGGSVCASIASGVVRAGRGRGRASSGPRAAAATGRRVPARAALGGDDRQCEVAAAPLWAAAGPTHSGWSALAIESPDVTSEKIQTACFAPSSPPFFDPECEKPDRRDPCVHILRLLRANGRAHATCVSVLCKQNSSEGHPDVGRKRGYRSSHPQWVRTPSFSQTARLRLLLPGPSLVPRL